MNLEQYIESISKRYKLGNSTEHTYRGDLQLLLESIVPEIRATNEPKRQKCGAPDYILTKGEIPIGYIEAKDIGDLDLLGSKKTGNKEQFDRYKASLDNLIFTDYLDFHFYRDKELISKIAIAEVSSKGIKPLPENFQTFLNLINDFCIHKGQTIKSSKKLAEMMAGKARLLSDVIEKALNSDEQNIDNSTLRDQMLSFKLILIHDINSKSFADIYAQTITYGMFAARLHDPTLPTFSRQEAAELIPHSNPFLRKLFGYIAGPDLDDRIKWIVDGLVEIFLACNVREILSRYGKKTQTEDPIIHFYEDFLSEYDPKLRKSRGVWYTPSPVVKFIVKSVDEILKTEFNLKDGLADNSKTTIKVTNQGFNKKEEQEVHKVQILDPAAGTGTFLAETIKHVHKNFEGQQGLWSNYVENHLLPRLNGFELLMASYAMAHLKLDLLLTETGFKPQSKQRFRVFLTNSLEEHHPDTGTLFANWLSFEASEANTIKRDTPVMCIIGNPPYSGESANKGEWIMSLMDDYKKEPGGKEKLKERNPKWINDDYVKFLRYGQHYIEKNGSGVLAFINPHGFLDNPTFRGMRWNLLKTYDKIYTIDLHGNSKKKERSPDGSVDENVFDIMQGVSINFFIKTGKKAKKELAEVFHSEIFGKRTYKYDLLQENSLSTIPFQRIASSNPNYFLVPKNSKAQINYDKGFSLNQLMTTNVLGFQTHRDNFAIAFTKETLIQRVDDLLDKSIENSSIKNKYSINESKSWILNDVRRNLSGNKEEIKNTISEVLYRPFDKRYAILDRRICDRPRKEILQHINEKINYSLLCSKQQAVEGFRHVFISVLPANDCVMSTTSREANQIFPLYLYPKHEEYLINFDNKGIPNLNKDILYKIIGILKIPFSENEIGSKEKYFCALDLLDYIYAIVHSPKFREDYKEFLKTGFPKIPYPKNTIDFFNLVELGANLRKLHLFKSPILDKLGTIFPVDGDRSVTKVNYVNQRVYINESVYFGNVTEVAWNFYIGGYQPAQKWLKDRKGEKLDFDDIIHYQKIIVALIETDRIMKEIDKIDFD